MHGCPVLIVHCTDADLSAWQIVSALRTTSQRAHYAHQRWQEHVLTLFTAASLNHSQAFLTQLGEAQHGGTVYFKAVLTLRHTAAPQLSMSLVK